jgi:2-methylisocitrate lyase-like PEP mutase family enzyme
MSALRPTTALRRMILEDLVHAPFIFDAFQAKLAAHVGARAVYMTGYGTAASYGFPDVGLLTMTEMVANAARISEAVDLPVIADADTGYGNAITVRRTVREYERAGVAAIHIEDQAWPKKCGFFAGKQVIDRAEAANKIRSAVDARHDDDFLIIARTDALAVNGWDDAEARARAYLEAGANMVFVDGIRTAADVEEYARRLQDAPRLLNGTATPERVRALGFQVLINPSTMVELYQAFLAAARAVVEGTYRPMMPSAPSEMAEVLGLPAIYELEQKFAT